MTTYRKIHGRAIQAVTTDPSESVAEGQVWYNTNSDTFKSVILTSAWSSASPMGRNPANDTLGGCGTPTAGLGFGGYSPPGGTVGLTEEYNGTGWATGGAMNTPEAAMGSFGTQTAAVSAGGSPNSAVTEEYNGTSWTTGNVMGTGRGYSASAGTETSGLIAGGNSPPILGNVEEYNGSTWSEQNNLGTSRYQFTGCGAANTAALVFGGSTPGDTGATEEYDGTNWTAGGSLNTGRRRLAGSGIQTSALAFGGNTTPPDTTRNLNEAYNGSTWAVSPATLATARTALGSTRTSSNNSSAVAFAGINSGGTRFTVTEEFTSSANVITGAAFSSGGAVPLANQDLASFGTQTAAIGAGGYSVPYTNAAYGYNGSSWTNLPNINTARTAEGAGTQTAGVIFGGNAPPADAFQNATEEWNGSSWTAVNNMVSAVSGDMAIGVAQTAVISVGGQSPAYPAREKQQEYDGTNWTAVSATLNNGRRNGSSHGTVTAALVAFGASPGPENVQNYAEEWNGSSWTSVPTANTARVSIKGFGTQTNAVASGGSNVGASVAYTQSERYNGTGWATAPSLANGRYNHGSAGVGSPTSLGLIFNGAPGYSTATEEFTDETTALNVKTLTQS
jgi:hypothetical protein